MKRFLLSLAVMLAVVLGIASPVGAEDYMSEVTNGLKHSPVYIVPQTEETNATTASSLKGVLYGGDGILLAMLPSAAETSLGTDAQSFVARLSERIGGRHIIGVTVGDLAIGYSSVMSSGIASDLMHRAASVSTNPVETLGTFVRNVHDWQRLHPKSKDALHPHKSSVWRYVWAGSLCISVVSLALYYVSVARIRQRTRVMTSRKRFRAHRSVNPMLTQIARLRDQVNDSDLRGLLDQCCVNVERYFMRYSNDRFGDALVFQDHLTRLTTLLHKYIEVQNNRGDYRSPDAVMTDVGQRVERFAQFVRASILAGSDAKLTQYLVDTDLG